MQTYYASNFSADVPNKYSFGAAKCCHCCHFGNMKKICVCLRLKCNVLNVITPLWPMKMISLKNRTVIVCA